MGLYEKCILYLRRSVGTVEWATDAFERNQLALAALADAAFGARAILKNVTGSVISCIALGLLAVVFEYLGLTFGLILLPVFLVLLLPSSRTLCVLMAFMIMTTDSVCDPHGIFAVVDLRLMEGLPTFTVWLLLLATVVGFLFSFTMEQRRSPVRIRFLVVLCGVLALSASRSHAWPAELFRVDLRSFLFPVLFFYFSMNALKAQSDVYRLIAVICATSVMKAVILDLYYAAGAGGSTEHTGL